MIPQTTTAIGVKALVIGDPKQTELNARSHESSMGENLVGCEAGEKLCDLLTVHDILSVSSIRCGGSSEAE